MRNVITICHVVLVSEEVMLWTIIIIWCTTPPKHYFEESFAVIFPSRQFKNYSFMPDTTELFLAYQTKRSLKLELIFAARSERVAPSAGHEIRGNRLICYLRKPVLSYRRHRLFSNCIRVSTRGPTTCPLLTHFHASISHCNATNQASSVSAHFLTASSVCWISSSVIPAPTERISLS